MSDSEYIYEIIDNDNDARYCAQLIAEEFSAHNPITIFDQITPTHFYDSVSWPLMKDMFMEHLSFLARLRSTGEIIGATIAGDLYLGHQKKHSCDTENLENKIPVNDLLDEMDNSFISRDFGQELKPNMVLHITVGAVRAQHSNKGVASQIRKLMSDNARNKRGFQYLLVQTTNPATRHIYLNKMNGKEVTIVDPTTWIWKKKGDELLYPYKDYKGGLIPNILIKL
jgi:hypothetical protein